MHGRRIKALAFNVHDRTLFGPTAAIFLAHQPSPNQLTMGPKSCQQTRIFVRQSGREGEREELCSSNRSRIWIRVDCWASQHLPSRNISIALPYPRRRLDDAQESLKCRVGGLSQRWILLSISRAFIE